MAATAAKINSRTRDSQPQRTRARALRAASNACQSGATAPFRNRSPAWTPPVDMRMIAPRNASVAQLDRVLPSEGRGRGFESRRMRQIRKGPRRNPGAFFCPAGSNACKRHYPDYWPNCRAPGCVQPATTRSIFRSRFALPIAKRQQRHRLHIVTLPVEPLQHGIQCLAVAAAFDMRIGAVAHGVDFLRQRL